ncbi:hypothetical protein FHX42_002286 [Saccharopolyspora lacisalsi]|uniref:Uncharacterized protein n=1 Tax=Halosaccharopolyspora lacisalsi TaxID=1000566 RepID=A0A839DVZ7_9PSEU|nr:hypothetical protein [Halosaccharopolyspora lacisalsi]MBA8824939.1 hypothetical protein [Halosaccharopolyspora lacisalsi]
MSPVRSARPEATVLTDEQRSKVLAQLRHAGSSCRGCGSGDYHVGDALYLGFLFHSERTDAYMIALTCANPACPSPHNGVRYHASEWPVP